MIDALIAGGIEFVVVGVFDHALLAIFTLERKSVFIGETDKFVVNALADEKLDRRRVAVGHKINRALDGAEIAGAAGVDDQFACTGRRRRWFRGEPPIDRIADAL